MHKIAIVEPEIEDYSPLAYLAIKSVLLEYGFFIKFRRIRKNIKTRRKQYLKFPVLYSQELKNVKLLVVFSPYATSHNAKKWSLMHKVPLLHLELGFLYKSILCDIGGFWGDARILESINNEIDSCINDHHQQWAFSYSQTMIHSNTSKRKQIEKHTQMNKDFVFLPMQYMNDQSVIKFGNMPYPKFVKQTASFCADNKLILAIKKHPHAYKKEPKQVDSLIKKLKKQYGKTIAIVDGSVHWFCKNCKIVACMNSGVIADGLINGSIISHCGQSIFMNTGTVIHDANLLNSLSRCLKITEKEKKIILIRQRALLYFLYHKYLLLEEDMYNSALSNIQKVKFHLASIVP